MSHRRWVDPGIGAGCLEGEFVTVFSAFIDDGGNSREGVLCVGSYTAKAERWEAFNKRWLPMLDFYRVPYIHMKDVLNGQHKLYKHLNWRERRNMLDCATDIICDCAEMADLHHVSTVDYHKHMDAEYRSAFGSAYANTVGLLVADIIMKLKQRPDHNPDDILNVYIEGGAKNIGDTIQRLTGVKRRLAIDREAEFIIKSPHGQELTYNIGDIGTGDKTGPAARPPLQAADIYSYSYYHTLRNEKCVDGNLAYHALTKVARCIQHHNRIFQESFFEKTKALTYQIAEEESERNQKVHQLAYALRQAGWRVEQDEGGYKIYPPTPTPTGEATSSEESS